MKVSLLSVSLLLSFPMAFASFPTVKINGVDHYLAQFTNADWADTADGYCAIKGEGNYGSYNMWVTEASPLVRLDSMGHVLETYSDNQGGEIATLTSIFCD